MSTHLPSIADVAESHWSLDPCSHPLTVGALLDCVAELGTAAQGLVDKRALFNGDGGWRVLQAIVRQMSIPLRKLCLDGDGGLLKKVVADPTLHPLGGTKGRYRGAEMSWRTDRREVVLGYADGKGERVVVPETEHAIEIGRLYGVDFLGEARCHVHEPFDLSAPRVAMDDWLSLKAAQVNSVSYTIQDALKIVADYEGAHTNELFAVVGVGFNPEDVDRGRNMKYRLINCVRFGCLSYAQILAMYAGLYVIREMQHLLTEVEQAGRVAELQASAVARTIGQVRTDLAGPASMTAATHELILVGVSNVPGKRRRQPVYRLWSGSQDWDAPAPDAGNPDSEKTNGRLAAVDRQ